MKAILNLKNKKLTKFVYGCFLFLKQQQQQQQQQQPKTLYRSGTLSYKIPSNYRFLYQIEQISINQIFYRMIIHTTRKIYRIFDFVFFFSPRSKFI